jgi:CheY-like chemotaxis protein
MPLDIFHAKAAPWTSVMTNSAPFLIRTNYVRRKERQYLPTIVAIGPILRCQSQDWRSIGVRRNPLVGCRVLPPFDLHIPALTSVELEPARSLTWPTKPLNVLVVDDTDQIRMWCHLQLQKLGHMVVSASSGIEAERILQLRSFDLLVTDVIMPDRDGLELILGLRKSRSGTHVLAMSGGGKFTQDADCLKMAMRLGAHAVVTKPFSLDQLIEKVAEAMDAEDLAPGSRPPGF